MSDQKMNHKQGVEKPLKKPEIIEEGYLNIIENTLKTFKEQKKADILYLNNIEYQLENYKMELEYMNQKNEEMYSKIVKLIEHKKVLDNEVNEDLKKTDKHIQLIKIQKEI